MFLVIICVLTFILTVTIETLYVVVASSNRERTTFTDVVPTDGGFSLELVGGAVVWDVAACLVESWVVGTSTDVRLSVAIFN